jgi:tetratricopeptide (TPR) repeat protein
MPAEDQEDTKKPLSRHEVLDASILISSIPIVLGVIAAIFLPLPEIAAHLPSGLRPFVSDAKSFGVSIFAIAAVIVYPFDWMRRHRKLHGYHPKGKYHPGKINIWVAEMEGDSPRHEERRRLVGALKDLFGNSLEILLADLAPRLVDTGIGGQEADEGNRLAREYLNANEGELILWGQFFKAPAPLIELHLVSAAQDGSEVARFKYDRATYRPTEKKFRPYFTGALAALIATMAEGAEGKAGGYVSDLQRGLLKKIEPLAESLPKDMGYRERARIFYWLGRLYSDIGSQDDSIPMLRLAVRLLMRARRCWASVQDSSRQAATTALALAWAAFALGSRLERPNLLLASLKAADLALAEFTPESDFLDWANCKLSQAGARYELGFRTKSLEHLEASAAAADAVLIRPETESYAEVRAVALEKLACTYSALAQIEEGDARLKAAIDTDRELLTIWTKDKAPLKWARVQLNLAMNLVDLWNHSQHKELLEEAWIACEHSLEVFSPKIHPASYGRAKSVEGQILLRQRQWKDAADLFHEALNYLSPETHEFEFHRVQESLRIAQEQMRRPAYVVTLGRQ